MPLVEKTLIRTGLYEAPQGRLRVNRRRLGHWSDSFQQMKAEGILVPCSWGHHADALPGDRRDRSSQQFWLSRYNAGYLRDLTVTPDGKLDGKLDCPGVELDGDKLTAWVKLPDGRQVKTAIGEVSLAIKDWKDGQGRTWKDSIVHCAITPLPVVHGTGGFRATLSSVCTGQGGLITLSLNSMLSTDEGDMAEEKEDTEKDSDEDNLFESKDKGEGGGKDESAGDGVNNAAGLQRGDSTYFTKALEFLEKKGIHLPDDTTPENFWERMCVAGHALDGADGMLDGDIAPAPEDPIPDGFSDDMPDMGDMEEMPEMPEDTDVDEEGETYSGEDDEEGDDVEEQRPVMMSLTTVKNRTTRKGIEREQERHKRGLLARIARLEKRLPKKTIDELKSQVEGYTLSLTEDWEIVPQRLDERISDFELSAAASPPEGKIPGGKVARRPDIRGESESASRKRQEKIGIELAERAGFTVASN